MSCTSSTGLKYIYRCVCSRTITWMRVYMCVEMIKWWVKAFFILWPLIKFKEKCSVSRITLIIFFISIIIKGKYSSIHILYTTINTYIHAIIYAFYILYMMEEFSSTFTNIRRKKSVLFLSSINTSTTSIHFASSHSSENACLVRYFPDKILQFIVFNHLKS